MNEGIFSIVGNRRLTAQMYEMRLAGDTSAITAPGQFVNIRLDGLFLRRPISVCRVDAETITLLYKTVGEGTAQMAQMKGGDRLNLLTGLGNGFDAALSGNAPLLIGGGAGVPPLYGLAERLLSEGKQVTVILGFHTEAEIYYRQEFKKLGSSCNAGGSAAGGTLHVLITTVDGSAGIKGIVTDALPQAGTYTYTYACGSEAMLRAVYTASETSGQYSFEARMGCGFGACMGCSCETLYGSIRICRDGPVLRKEEIRWGR